MKKFKFLNTIFLFILFVLLTPSSIHAGDLDIFCGNDGELTYTPTNIDSFFNTSNWVPGRTEIKTIDIFNEDTDETCDLTLLLNVDTNELNIADKIFTSIETEDTTIFGSNNGMEATSLETLNSISGDTFNIVSVPPLQDSTVTWYMTFDSTAGNEFQGKGLSFDFLLNFQWGNEQDGQEVLGLGSFEQGGYLHETETEDSKDIQEEEVLGESTCEQTYKISGVVFYDRNDNGIQDKRDKGVKDIDVKIYDKDGNLVKTVQTDADGNWEAYLCPGEYVVKVEGAEDQTFVLGKADTSLNIPIPKKIPWWIIILVGSILLILLSALVDRYKKKQETILP